MKRKASAGSMESSDVLVVIQDSDKRTLTVNSIVEQQYGEQIAALAERIINESGLENVEVLIQDRGALDYAIQARLETAIARFKEEI